MSITIYGSSDDVVCVGGDISEEFDAVSLKGPALLAFSDGTILSIEFTDEADDGLWRIKPVTVPESELLTIAQCPVTGPGCSDRAELRADVDWVVYGSAVAHNRH